MINRRQLLKNACTTAAIVATVPTAIGAELADTLTEIHTEQWQQVTLNKGETVFYTDPVSGQRQQIMAVTDAMQVNVPQTASSILPRRSKSRDCVAPKY